MRGFGFGFGGYKLIMKLKKHVGLDRGEMVRQWFHI